MFRQFLSPPRLRSTSQREERHATWLELFYDLVLVVAVSQVADTLSEDHSLKGLMVFIGLFLPIWWVWAGHTVYATRFDTDDLIYRQLTFLQMFAVMGMAVEAQHAAGGYGQRFGASYLAARIILLLLLTRAFYHVPEGRHFNRIYLIGFGTGAAIWASSLLLPARQQFILWGISLAIEFTTPWLVWRKKHPSTHVSASHIPERLGLFTIIVLGESVVAAVRGLAQEQWLPAAFATAALGFVFATCIWWIYFRHLERAIGRIRLGSGQPYIYSHLPLLIGIVVVSVGLVLAIIQSHQPSLPGDVIGLLWGGFFLWLLGSFLLHRVACPPEARTSIIRYAGMFAAVCFFALVSRFLPPVVVVAIMSACALVFVFMEERTRLGTTTCEVGKQ